MEQQARLLGDRYELGEVIGRGGMADVRIGRDARLGRSVAVKTLRADLAADSTFQKRFRREAQSAASLNHPNIASVYDTGEDIVEGVSLPYIVMEYVDGSTLRDLVSSGRRLLPERAMEITAGVLLALDYSHHNGIVHRDIKPANVMLTRNGAVKVMDFGIARAIADVSATMTATAAVIGTAQYLSPEQAKGEKVDARSDIYSTGCLLYELLTGRPPFTGDSPVSVAYQHVRENPVPPSQLDPEITPAVDAIVLKSLAKNADNRYQSAGEMREDIERAIEGRPVNAPPVLADAVTQRIGAPTVAAGATTMMAPVGAEAPPARRSGGYVLLGLAVLALLIGGFFLGRSLLSGANTVAVPALVGVTEEQAKERLAGKGLVVGDVDRVASESVSPGRVISQDPGPEERIEEGGAVNLVVSSGPSEVTVPPIVGETLDDAKKMLSDAGLEVGDVDQVDSDRPKDEVVSASPDEGASVAPGTTVNLKVSSGVEEVEVPDVRNQAEDIAKARLEEAGFKVKIVRQEQLTATDGTVFEQVPSPGQKRPKGSEVTIYVADNPDVQPSPTNTGDETFGLP